MNDDEKRLLSPCCNAVLYSSRADGVTVGSCITCHKHVVRLNPRTGIEQWLDERGPWFDWKPGEEDVLQWGGDLKPVERVPGDPLRWLITDIVCAWCRATLQIREFDHQLRCPQCAVSGLGKCPTAKLPAELQTIPKERR